MCRCASTRGVGSTNVAFFFSSRRRHTRSLRDWSSDVCSSDLGPAGAGTRLKLVLNTWLAFEIEAAAEVDALASQLDVPHDDLVSAVSGGTLASAVALAKQIGRASCRERVWMSVGGVWVKRKVV